MAALALAVLIGAFVNTTEARARTGQEVVKIVMRDPGGSLSVRQKEIRSLRRSGRRVELRGMCFSACTMYLALENVCVSRDAVFGFHGPRGLFGSLDRDAFEHWSQVMARDLREPLRGWFMAKARHVRSGVMKVRGSTLIEMGYPRCAPPRP